MLENDAQQLGCFSDIADHHGGLVEVRRDFKRAAERFDVTAQITHMHVTALQEP